MNETAVDSDSQRLLNLVTHLKYRYNISLGLSLIFLKSTKMFPISCNKILLEIRVVESQDDVYLSIYGRFAPSSVRPLDVSPPGRFALWTVRPTLWTFRPLTLRRNWTHFVPFWQ